MGCPLTPAQAIALASLLVSLPSTNFPGRRPSYTRPTFWSRPRPTTRIEPLAQTGTWQDWLTIQGSDARRTVVEAYSASTIEPLATPGVEFRFRLNGKLLDISLAPGVDVSKDANDYPFKKRSTYLTVGPTDTLTMQVRNTGALQRTVCGAFWAYEYNDENGAGEKSAAAGMTDV